jgi:hypothetical protein
MCDSIALAIALQSLTPTGHDMAGPRGRGRPHEWLCEAKPPQRRRHRSPANPPTSRHRSPANRQATNPQAVALAFTIGASCVSISSTISSSPKRAFQPQSFAASLSSIERGQLAAIAWRKSGTQSIVKPGMRR